MQTDVMRFMAILALCLVAIFALVQSIPLAPTVASEAAAEPQPVFEPEIPEPVAAPKPEPPPPPEPIETAVADEAPPQPPPPPVVTEAVEAPPPAAEPAPVEAPPPAPVQAEADGFTLRFESDQALTRLVARNEVGLYAISPESSLRMNVNRGRFSFWPASTPQQFHEMHGTTVPASVTGALESSGRQQPGAVQWGVTIPSRMSRQLDSFLSEYRSGELVIGADGQLRLENGR